MAAPSFALRVLRAEIQPGKSPSGHRPAVALEVQPADRSLAASGITLYSDGSMDSHQEFIDACNLEAGDPVPARARGRVLDAYFTFLREEAERVEALRLQLTRRAARRRGARR